MDELPLFYPQIKDLDCAALGGLDEEKKVVVEKYLLILQTDTPLDKAQLEKNRRMGVPDYRTGGDSFLAAASGNFRKFRIS